MKSALLVIGDLSLLAGLVVLSLALLGLWRFPDVFTRLHATTKVSSLGLAAILLGSLATAEGEIVARALLVAAFLVLTAPVSTHAMARAAWRRSRRERAGEPDEAEPAGGDGG